MVRKADRQFKGHLHPLIQIPVQPPHAQAFPCISFRLPPGDLLSPLLSPPQLCPAAGDFPALQILETQSTALHWEIMWSAEQNTACCTTGATQKALTLLIPGDATAVNPCGAFIRVWMLHGVLGTSLQAEKEPFPVPTPGIKTTNRNLSWTSVKGKTIACSSTSV